MSKDVSIDKCVDRDFVFALATRGHVNVLTRQVSVRGERLDLSGIKIPVGCEVEYVSAKPTKDEWHPEVCITFGWK